MNLRASTISGSTLGPAALLLALALGFPAATARAQECTEDSDCPSGFECDRAPAACTDDGSGTPQCDTPMGECEPGAIGCDADADCPLALSCETVRNETDCAVSPRGARGEGDSAGAADAGAGEGEPEDTGCTTEEVPVDEPQCVYAPAECTDDDACDPGFACQALGREESCTDSPSNCPPGESCEPSEPVCTSVESTHYCFPERMDCAEDSDCDSDWRCVELPEDAQEHPIPGYEGASTVCMPEGIALFFEGNIEVGSSIRSSSESSQSRSNDSATDAMGTGGPGGASDDADESGGEAGDMKESSGCSVAAADGGPGLEPVAFGAALAWLGRRRRRS